MSYRLSTAYLKDEKIESAAAMDKFKICFIAAFSAIFSGMHLLTLPVLLLVLCNVIDYGTGMAASVSRGIALTPGKSLRGIAKKVGMWLLIVIGWVLDVLIEYGANTIGMESPISFLIATIVAVWLICNEILSILENLVQIGVAVPGFLMPLVRMIQKQAEEKGGQEKGKKE